MKMFLAAGRYVGTKAEAKKLDKGFEPVEVPTDKEGLIAFLNGLAAISEAFSPDDFEDEFETVVKRQDPSAEEHDAFLARETFDAEFEALAPTHQLHLAALAAENARNALVSLSLRVLELDKGGIEEEDDETVEDDPFA